MRLPGQDWLKSKFSAPQPRGWDDDPTTEPLPNRRLRIVARFAFAWALIILLRLVQLQIARHDDFRAQARSQQEKVVEIQAPRGTIFDRNGRPLAMSLPVDSVCVNPRVISDVGVAADVLSEVLQLDRNQLYDRLKASKDRQQGFLLVQRRITREQSARLRTYPFPWLEFPSESHRFYPKGELAAHVVGSVNSEEHGVVGIESYFEDDLEGRPGTMRVVTDSKQRGVDSVVSTEPVAGASIYCTIDERIQFVVERELKKAVVENNCKTGSVVVMDPKTGQILAMASYPTFNPNEPLQPGETLASRLNLAVSAPFEPGSVFKVITLAAALETTKLRPESIIPCGNGVINLFGRIIHDHNSYSALAMIDVLAHSSNIGAIQVGLRVGDKNMYEYVRAFGFGNKTGIGLPAESDGVVRKLKNWQPSSIGSVAMGHELLTTTLQLAQACSIVANGGQMIRPKITIKSNRPGQQLELVNAEKPRQVLQPDNAITMRSMMEAVVLRGTGRKAQIAGYSAGGKTGSAQIFDTETRAYSHKYNASFMGFAPLNNPAVVIVVTLNGASKYGGAVAAPVFHEVATAALRILDVPRDLPDGALPKVDSAPAETNDLAIAELASPPAPEVVPSSAVVEVSGAKVPNFEGKTMRNVLEMASSMGIQVEFVGAGIARAQSPAPGAALPPGERIRIQFAR